MTAIKSKRMTAKKKTMDRKNSRKDKWHFQEAWMQIDKIKEHLDSMNSDGDVPVSGQQPSSSRPNTSLPVVV